MENILKNMILILRTKQEYLKINFNSIVIKIIWKEHT